MDFDRTACEKIHNRNINITTYAHPESALILEGRLTDERFFPSHNLFGEARPAGTVHDMIVRIKISGPKLAIDDIEAEMITVPNPECREALSSLLPLKGERITAGFTARVHQLVGGPRGCAHLVALARAMASATIQGAWAAVSRISPAEGSLSKRSLKSVIDTCHIWRSDGPLVQRVKQQLQSGQSDKP